MSDVPTEKVRTVKKKIKPIVRAKEARAARKKMPIQRLSLHEQVVERLRDLIISGQLQPGRKILVGELATELGISLTPMREALKVLSGEQLVDLVPNRGARVRPITIDETRDLFDVMSSLEALAAERAAKNMSADELAKLEEKHTQMLERYAAGDEAGYFRLNREIHDMIVAASSNPILALSRGKLAVRAERIRYLAVVEGRRRDEAVEDHERLMAAFRKRDSEAARRIWRRHLLRSGEDYCEVLKAVETG